jgi:hypothetical protein
MGVSGAIENVSNNHLLQTLWQLGYPTAIEFWVEHFSSNSTTVLAFDRRNKAPSPVRTWIPHHHNVFLTSGLTQRLQVVQSSSE